MVKTLPMVVTDMVFAMPLVEFKQADSRIELYSLHTWIAELTFRIDYTFKI